MDNTLISLSREPFAKAEARKAEVEAARKAQAEKWIPAYLPALDGAFMMACADHAWRVESVSYAYDWAKMPPRAYVYIRAYIKVDAWSDLTRLFEILDAAGLATIERWKSQDDAASYTRIYSYDLQPSDSNNTALLQIHATLPGDTDTCRRVIVGYENEEYTPAPIPKYELRCDGDGTSDGIENLG